MLLKMLLFSLFRYDLEGGRRGFGEAALRRSLCLTKEEILDAGDLDEI